MKAFNDFIKSAGYAFKGILAAVKGQRNIKYMLASAVMVIVSIFIFRISRVDSMMIIFAVFFVIALEVMNTAIEKLIDKIHPKHHEKIGAVKDIMAGAVLIATILSVIIGVMVFYGPVMSAITGLLKIS